MIKTMKGINYMEKNYDSFREIEDFVRGFCSEKVLFCNYEEDDLVETYISNIFTYYFQEIITQDLLENGFDEKLIDLTGGISVDIPKELIDYYREAVDLSRLPVTTPADKK